MFAVAELAVTTTIPEVLADLPRVRARATPSAVALSCGGRDTTYGALDERSSRVANAILAAGCGPADRIAYLGKNSDSYFEILFGGAKARVATVAVNWRLAPPEVEYVLADSGPGSSSSIRSSRRWSNRCAIGSQCSSASSCLAPMGRAETTHWRDPNKSRIRAWGRARRCRPPDVQQRHDWTTEGSRDSSEGFAPLRRAERELGPWATVGAGESSLIVMPIFHMLGTGLALTALLRWCALRGAPRGGCGRDSAAYLGGAVTHLIVAPAFLSLLSSIEVVPRRTFLRCESSPTRARQSRPRCSARTGGLSVRFPPVLWCDRDDW